MPAVDQPPTESQPEPTLLELARRRFATLSPAEEELFRAAQEGREASAFTRDEKEDNPANAATWNADRVVRAESITWLCTDPKASALVTYRGLTLRGMRIDADLDLHDAEFKFSLIAYNCAFSGNILLRNARLRGLYFWGCFTKNLNADGARIAGPVFLRNGFKAEGEVGLKAATIDRDLGCEGAQLSNPNGIALTADRAKIKGSIFLRVKTDGELRLLGATIGGNLNCDGAQLSNPNGKALSADGAKIAGSVSLRSGFKAEGEVRLLGATIGGNLQCDGAQLSNPNGMALVATSANIGGNILFHAGLKAEGEVKLFGAIISGNLQCENAQFLNPKNYALTATGARIAGIIDLRAGFKAEGIVDLRLMKAAALCDDKESWPLAGNLFLDGFNYERLVERSPLER